MTIDENTYLQALTRLRYVATVKRKLGTLLSWLCHASQSDMYITTRRFDSAVEGLNELIDDVFYDEITSARTITDTYEREDYLAALNDWHNP